MATERSSLLDQSRLVSVVPATFTWEQLQPGKLSVAFSVVSVGPLIVSSRAVNLAFHAHGQVASHRSGLMAVQSDSEARWRGSTFGSASLAIGNEIDVRTTRAGTLFGIAVDQPSMRQAFPDSLDACDLMDYLSRTIVMSNPTAAARVRRAIKLICSRQKMLPPTASGTLVPMLTAALSEIDNHSVDRSHCLNRRYAAVRACELYMREHIEETVTLVDLSRACGVRSRSLINAFEAITDFSPMEYLKRLRLSLVRSALLRADARCTRVIDVAMEWGFWHMGHFAHDYRAMFGEAPSQTLSQSAS